MDKKKLYFYYWGLLEGEEKEEVERYLSDEKNKEEYEQLENQLEYLFPSADSEEYEMKIIPFSEIRENYRARREHEEKIKRRIITGAVVGVLLVVLFTGLFILGNAGIIGSKNTHAQITFIKDQKVVIINSEGRPERIFESGTKVSPGESVYTAEGELCAIGLGADYLLQVEENTLMTVNSMKKTFTGTVEAEIEISQGSITVRPKRKDKINNILILESSHMRTKTRAAVFSIKRVSDENSQLILKSGKLILNSRFREILGSGNNSQKIVRNDKINNIDIELVKEEQDSENLVLNLSEKLKSTDSLYEKSIEGSLSSAELLKLLDI